MSVGKPILITGSHRSGTTWAGKMIALSSKVVYILEPFNKDRYTPGICHTYFETPFFYITQDNGADYYDSLSRTVNLKYNWDEAVAAAQRTRELAYVGGTGISLLYHRARQHRPLLKDPFALLSAPWLVEQFNATPVVLIRHPAAFVGSVKRFGWESSIDILLQQPLLMRDYLNPLREEMEQFVSAERTIVEQAAQFWKLLYYIVDIFQQRYPHWLFVRHEDLSRAPQDGFRQIFDYLSLPYTAKIQSTIEQYTSKSNPNYSKAHTAAVKLNSQANIWSWQERLAPAEVERIQAITGDIARKFYADDEWGQP